MDFKAFLLDVEGRFVGATTIHAEAHPEALDTARKLLTGSKTVAKIEIWRGDELIGKVAREPAR